MVRKLLFKNSIILLFLSLNSFLSLSQTYQFNNYSVNEGLPGRFIYTINQDNDGFIWLGTDKGLCFYDGFEYHMSYVSDTLETNFPISSYEAQDGIIYFGFNDGTVHYTEDRNLKEIPGIDAVRINNIFENKDSMIFIITQSKGIYAFDPDNPTTTISIDNPVNEFLFCGAFTEDGQMVLGTQNGLSLCSFEDDTLKEIAVAEEMTYNKVQDIKQSNKPALYFIGTEDNGLYAASFNNGKINIKRIGQEDIFNRSRIQSLMTDSKGTLWISTFGNGLVKVKTDSTTADIISYEVLGVDAGMPGNDIKTSYEDEWGNIWIGHFGSGVSVLRSEAYKFYRPGNVPDKNNIIYVGEFKENIFAGTSEGYYLFDINEERTISYTDLRRSVNGARISDYYLYNDGSILLGTEWQGVYKREASGRTTVLFRSGNNMENYIEDILDESGFIWLGTRGGVISINKATKSISRFTTSEKLPHNNINQVVPLGDGNVIVATESNRLYQIRPGKGVSSGKAIIHGGVRNVFQSFDVEKENKIWGATRGSGIFCFEGDAVWNIRSRNGLYSDFCYSILCDSRNKIWVGHRRGFSVYNQAIDEIRTFVDIFGTGADCNENAIYETSQGHVLIGTTNGFIVYNPDKEKQKLKPPKTNILSVTINDSIMPLKDVYNLPYKSRYTVKIDYVGLNYSDPEKVYYSYSLENYDTEWSDPTYTRSVTYRLSDGSYRFNILAYVYEDISDNEIKSFEINIKKPFWETWWFISAAVLLLVVIVVVIIKVRERKQARVKKFLEDELAERTKEVIVQKEEIEYKNREITDSINYAQRIQASLLPPVKRLNENFQDSFVFFRPRDIVSGDFYWFDKVSDDKIMIVCADSTGHGVPGAFMSMIGSALLQEIVNRKDITRPSEILRALDNEITTTLNQTGDDTSNDGMDMVVCEYNPKIRLLRVSSALRPVIIVMDGEQYYIRGNKNSVGGEYMEEKFFDDQEYYLKQNDIVYLFSDGYPDQFGGSDGKKLKIVRLKRLIEEIKDLNMEEQQKRVSDYFDEWKGSYAQVDDVLLMGFRI
ncbi:MAG: two-component regulator propeller domain-containing protein [Bacteroidota bacterium]|nr:two-component regulator propeller domain-containing protein [Bacteroidota bacterium]